MTGELLDMGCYEVSLGDTIGTGTAGSMQRLLDVLLRDSRRSSWPCTVTTPTARP